MLPTISTTVGWTFLLDPDSGLLNVGLSYLGIGAFNIYSVPGIVFAHLMSSQISQGVMLLTPAFRNMDSALEEAARMSGASTMRTMLRVTLPLMMPPILVVFMLKMARIMQSFEIEQILGTPINFFIYSTKIYNYMRLYEPPKYGIAAALASVTLLVVVFIIVAQRKLLGTASVHHHHRAVQTRSDQSRSHAACRIHSDRNSSRHADRGSDADLDWRKLHDPSGLFRGHAVVDHRALGAGAK